MMMIVWLILVGTTRNFRGNAFILLRVDSNCRGIEAKEKTRHPEVCLRSADCKCKKIADLVPNDGCLHFIKENDEVCMWLKIFQVFFL
ncbi:unnamed protein product [Musa hybrid cultivar]